MSDSKIFTNKKIYYYDIINKNINIELNKLCAVFVEEDLLPIDIKASEKFKKEIPIKPNGKRGTTTKPPILETSIGKDVHWKLNNKISIWKFTNRATLDGVWIEGYDLRGIKFFEVDENGFLTNKTINGCLTEVLPTYPHILPDSSFIRPKWNDKKKKYEETSVEKAYIDNIGNFKYTTRKQDNIKNIVDMPPDKNMIFSFILNKWVKPDSKIIILDDNNIALDLIEIKDLPNDKVNYIFKEKMPVNLIKPKWDNNLKKFIEIQDLVEYRNLKLNLLTQNYNDLNNYYNNLINQYNNESILIESKRITDRTVIEDDYLDILENQYNLNVLFNEKKEQLSNLDDLIKIKNFDLNLEKDK